MNYVNKMDFLASIVTLELRTPSKIEKVKRLLEKVEGLIDSVAIIIKFIISEMLEANDINRLIMNYVGQLIINNYMVIKKIKMLCCIVLIFHSMFF